MTGAEYIARFLAETGCDQVSVLTGGACAFMVDAVARQPGMSYACYLHEQAAAMAADVRWRIDGKPGVAMATSGPGATNLITGIACSYFDSIPSLHLTGQVNQREIGAYGTAKPRQSGFQETRIVEMVRPITKYAVMARSTDELRQGLATAYGTAMTGRRGPVLIDVPMDVQQSDAGTTLDLPVRSAPDSETPLAVAEALSATLANARRPIVLWGAGIGLAGAVDAVCDWLARTGLPFVASWAGLSAFDHDHANYVGPIGVYGNRGANFALQNADAVIVLGSRLDNRQRSGNPRNFAIGAAVHVIDVDPEELRKYHSDGYRTSLLDFAWLAEVLAATVVPAPNEAWSSYVREMKDRYFGRERSTSAIRLNTLSPYDVVRRMNEVIERDAIVVGDTGAAVCWLYQAFKVKRHRLVSAGGNSPMGYALPAAIGAKLAAPARQVIAYNGDGGFQLNIQELQTLKHLDLDLAIVVMNNCGYGIIRQFQDSYLGGRYHASRDGYSAPDFGRVAQAYGFGYSKVERLEQITPALFNGKGPSLLEVVLSPDTLIEPKLEMGRPINDQFPYLPDDEYAAANRFVAYPRPGALHRVMS